MDGLGRDNAVAEGRHDSLEFSQLPSIDARQRDAERQRSTFNVSLHLIGLITLKKLPL